MPNNNAPYGFRQLAKPDGNQPNFGTQAFVINSSDANLYFTGDPVALSSVAVGALQPYFGSSVAPVCLGIFQGCEFFSPVVGKVIWSPFFPGAVSSSSPVTAYVVTDPDTLWTVQCSSGPLGSSNMGQNFNITGSSSLGNQATGISVVTLNSSTVVTQVSSTNLATPQPFKIWNSLNGYSSINSAYPGGDDTVAFNTMVVKPATWQRNYIGGLST
jgi:hypothetical protein